MRKIILLVIICLIGSIGLSAGQSTLPTPTCAWQFEWSPLGMGNWLLADAANRWPYMPIDANWQQLTIKGAFPKARFFSLAVYDNAPVSTGLSDHLFDAQIVPDQGDPSAYTVTVTRGSETGNNLLHLHADTGWLVYRIYLPNEGVGTLGGVPLPEITVTHANGSVTMLPSCQVFNRQSELTQLQPLFVPPQLEYPMADPSIFPPVPDRIWFGAIQDPPPSLLPNPDQKYMFSFFMPEYEPGRLLVVRGKMPGFPDTYHGRPVSQPAHGFKNVQLRSWGACLAELVSPLPITGCATDVNTPLDGHGFYTIVVSNDVLRPEWLPHDVVWIPWGDEKMVPKFMFVRNLLASDDFGQSVQSAVAQGCGVNFSFPIPPTQEQTMTSGQCAQAVMGDYYPEAAWCDKSTFIHRGWQACLQEASSWKADKGRCHKKGERP